MVNHEGVDRREFGIEMNLTLIATNLHLLCVTFNNWYQSVYHRARLAKNAKKYFSEVKYDKKIC